MKKLTEKKIQINISEIKRPELDAVIVGNTIASRLKDRISYRRAIKTAIASAMRIGAEGIKVQISGRLGGAEMARSEQYKEGRIPLHTFVPISIMLLLKHILLMEGLVSKYGFVKVKFTEKVDLVPGSGMVKDKPYMVRILINRWSRDRDVTVKDRSEDVTR